jgi:HTH-type transcriptional regulator/antitoxin HipB
MKNFHIRARAASQVGESLRRRRKLLGWSQEELARRSGVKQGNLSAIESGVEGVRLGTIFRILAALDLELSIHQRQTSEPHIPEP